MKSAARVVALVTVWTLACLPLAAQSPDLSGNWSLQVTAYLVEASTPCVFEGTLHLSPGLNDQWTGPASLTLLSGPGGCPAEMMAQVTGGFDGPTFYGTLDGGELYGTASFTATDTALAASQGSVGGGSAEAGSKAALAPKAATSYGGPFTADSGPFNGAAGDFVAARQSILEIPTLTETGLAVMTLLLLATATFFLMRGRRQGV